MLIYYICYTNMLIYYICYTNMLILTWETSFAWSFLYKIQSAQLGIQSAQLGIFKPKLRTFSWFYQVPH